VRSTVFVMICTRYMGYDQYEETFFHFNYLLSMSAILQMLCVRKSVSTAPKLAHRTLLVVSLLLLAGAFAALPVIY